MSTTTKISKSTPKDFVFGFLATLFTEYKIERFHLHKDVHERGLDAVMTYLADEEKRLRGKFDKTDEHLAISHILTEFRPNPITGAHQRFLGIMIEGWQAFCKYHVGFLQYLDFKTWGNAKIELEKYPKFWKEHFKECAQRFLDQVSKNTTN